MQSNTAIKFLPAVQDDKKMEVSLEGNEAVLRLSTWTENLGWTCQKTLRLDAAMLDDLHRSITAARYRLNSQQTDSTEEMPGRVIKFPTAA